MSQKHDFDIAVIGAGPAGYVAGIRAAQLGASTCVIEQSQLGGVCTNVGCIPTKALWQSARMLTGLERAAEGGIRTSGAQTDYAAAGRRRDKIVATLRNGIKSLLSANGVQVFQAHASFADPHTLHLKGPDLERDLTAGKFVIATGSQPIELRAVPFDHQTIIDSSDAVLSNELPQSLLIVGGGYIGVEFAGIFSVLGMEVTMVEALERLLPGIDADCAAVVTKTLEKRSVKVHAGTSIEEARKDGAGAVARLSNGVRVQAQRVLVCVGRRPDCTGLDIEKAGLKTGEKSQIPVNRHMQTSQPHIYAAGDVVGDPLLAHVASHEAIVAVSHATGKLTAAMDYRVVPACMFAFPEIGTVGMSEEQAARVTDQVVVKKFPFRALGKAHITGQTDGFVKMIADGKTGELLGVHICGNEASCLLGEATLALKLQCTADELADTIHTHPTLPEALREAAEGIIGLPINWRG
jgi:dihydrolipoamide dehydrogenase